MGFGPSPFLVICFYYHGENPRDSNNALRWDKVVLNCPGSKMFYPWFPWVYKWDNIHKSVAGPSVTFVDDSRASGKDSEHVWQVSQQAATHLQYLWIQNAPRTIRPPTQVRTGAWAGSIIEASQDSVFKSIAKSNWDRVLPIIRRILQEIELTVDDKLDFKHLERERGFLVRNIMTYRTVNPYLKGMHHSIALVP